jgi:hypothetical protein
MAGRNWKSEVHRLNLATSQETMVIASATDRSFSVTNRSVYYMQNLDTYAELLLLE